ncbi:hypothetical protein FisN_13Hh056 [Fistulifera solaris]|jgi:hypothetical protein|uniref:Sulfotransferase domain-containing protein n=1 Tax=Fistulifera solaris TaxID=1519565 RepID=A0A1Z5KNU9_FISSO|nr:hypothetical protein FisN_13Hh056 [Fistulifera solaris]|eukprot:GAX27837.1 hypothetical protein FisN_13Hh056 [Fistulifera solaris]
MKPRIKQAFLTVRLLVGIAALWVASITWNVFNGIEIPSSLPPQADISTIAAVSQVIPVQTLNNFSSYPSDDDSFPSEGDFNESSSSSDLYTPTHSSANNATKPHLVIHIGPEKTASTTLQKDFFYKFRKHTFKADNYIYLGRYTFLRALQEVLLYCPYKLREKPKHPCYQRFLRLLDDERWRGKNILLSEEVYSKAIWDLEAVERVQQDFLPFLQERWDVSVVAVYRRFHEWLISARKQRDYELRERQLWPHEGGEALDSWNEVRLLRKHERFGLRSHYLPDDLAQWYDLNVTVTVLNMHHPTQKITEQFVCDAMPHATRSCEYYRTQGREIHANARSGLEYFFDNIVYAAAEKGILDTNNVMRHDIVANLTTMNMTITNMPLICPSVEDLEELLQESIHWEQYYAPEFADIGAVKDSFEKLVQSNQFCRVDTDRMLEGMTKWSDVLKRLGDDFVTAFA